MNTEKQSSEERIKIGLLEGYVSSIGNLILFIIKLIFGIISHSYALIVDSIHSLSDILTSVVVIIGFKISSKPADKEHPFGHQRVEMIAILIISFILIIVGIEFARSGISKILKPNVVKVNILLVIIVVFTILFKEIMARFSFSLEKRIGSDALKADAWHHRSDSISSLLVLISIIGSYYNIFWLDGVMGILIAFFIVYVGIRIMIKAANQLIGVAPSQEMVKKIRRIIYKYDIVRGVHDIIINNYGKLFIGSVHVVLPSSLSLTEAHEIVDDIEKTIRDELKIAVTIHIDPVDENDSTYKKIKAFLSSKIGKEYGIEDIHDIHLVKHNSIVKLYFEIQFSGRKRDKKAMSILRDSILKCFSEIDEVYIETEPEYTY